MPDRPVPPAGYLLRYDNQTGEPLFVNAATGERIPAAAGMNASAAASDTAAAKSVEPAERAYAAADAQNDTSVSPHVAVGFDAKAAAAPGDVPASTPVPSGGDSAAAGAVPADSCVGFIRRLFAFMIDLLVLLLPRLLFWAVGIAFTVSGSALGDAIFFRFSALDILWYLAMTAYFVVMTKCCGATLGKRVLRIKVVRSDGGAPDWWSVLYRETVGRYLTSLLCIGYLVMMGDRQHRGFHDMLADTRVVYCAR
ncbi:MAG: RDD family protein [Oscillospiraceae bacterium]|nr:RDD family protein [Oscillospiraceae bacterium]